jgi:hypothetical protein
MLITLTSLNLVKQFIQHVELVFEPHVSSNIPIKPILVRPIKITIPPNTFQQHLLKTFFQLKVGKMEIDETLVQIIIQNLCIVGWTIIEEEQLTKINLGFKENLQQVKINVDLEHVVSYQLLELLKEFEDIFAWTYIDCKGIPPDVIQHQIQLITLIPYVHQTRYRLNFNYVAIIKQDIDKLLITSLIKLVEEATWLSSIIIMRKKSEKLIICVDFKKLDAATKKDPYPLSFTDEVINTIGGHEVYIF